MPVVGRGAAVARAANMRRHKQTAAYAEGPAPLARLSAKAKQRVQWPCCLRVSAWFAPLWKHQRAAVRLYQKKHIQYAIAALILLNFFGNIIESQLDPFGQLHPEVWQVMEDIFNSIFLIELLVNAYAHWFVKFWASGWNIFDVLVVAVGMLSVARVELPGALNLLRMLRAFRVFRLFKRIKSLNRIVVSLMAAVPGIANVSFIMLLVMCIYAILGVEFYASFGESGLYNNSGGGLVNSITEREMAYGEEYFGTFSAALFTMFQILTGESWAEAVARPVIFQDNIAFRIGSAAFFVSFILINSVVLINVVVAVLLEKCIVAPDAPAGSVNPHRLEEHSRFLEDPAIETRIVEARLIPAFPVEQGAVRAAHQVSYAKPASAPGLGVGGESRPAAEMVHPDSSEGDDKIDDGRNSVAGGGGGGHGRPGDPPSGSIPEGDVGPAGVVGSHYYDPLKEEVEQLRKQIPMLLMAVQAQARQIKSMSAKLARTDD